jgi:uncharacterized protein YqeY
VVRVVPTQRIGLDWRERMGEEDHEPVVGLELPAQGEGVAMSEAAGQLAHGHGDAARVGQDIEGPVGDEVGQIGLRLVGAPSCERGDGVGMAPCAYRAMDRDGGVGNRRAGDTAERGPRERDMTEPLKARLRADLNESRRARDRLRTTVLTTVLSEVRNKEIELGRDATDEDVIGVVAKGIKQRKESSEQMREAGRSELAEREEREAEILDAYTPAGLSEEEVRVMVREIVAGGADGMGAVMGALMPRIRGRFDGSEANRIVREELG